MVNFADHKQEITAVEQGSPASRAGICAGDALLEISGEPVIDLIDYEYLTSASDLTLKIASAAGEVRAVHIRKDEYEPLGLCFQTSLMDRMRVCRNRCVFCFVDQMPHGLRGSLSVKDDDWRMSFVMGNYVTLTNLSDAEFSRILARRVAPLYVSVHATDGALRARMMQNPTAARIMERLTALFEAGLRFHAQVVLCPGWNDGAALEKSIQDLAALYPAAQSVAIVPVGLTKFRDGLTALTTYDTSASRAVISQVQAMQRRFLSTLGTSFAFLSDEWYLKADLPLPEFSHYEDFQQIENGVGLLRQYEDDFLYALSEREPLAEERRVTFAGGTGCQAFFSLLYQKLLPYRIVIETVPVKNDFFGGNVNVAGLITGSDLLAQLPGRVNTDVLLIPQNMLREGGDVFLDDITLEELAAKLGKRILPVGSGEDLINTVFGEL